MKLNSLNELFHDQLKDLYSAESQITRALPKMAKNASSPALKSAFQTHLEETKGQIERLQKIGEVLGLKLSGKKCKAMEGLIEEGKEVLEAESVAPVRDAGLIAAAQRVEHYEISAYGTARALAEQLGYKQAITLLQKTLDEESATDEKLTQLSLKEVLPLASAPPAADASEKEAKPAAKAAKTRKKVAE